MGRRCRAWTGGSGSREGPHRTGCRAVPIRREALTPRATIRNTTGVETLNQLQQRLSASSLPRRAWAGAECVVQGALLTLRSPALLRLALPPTLIHLVLYPL